jgi:hypothetical protein
LLNPRPAHPPADSPPPPWAFFWGTFLDFYGRFSVRGVQKHHKNVLTKSPCRKIPPKKSISFGCQFFLDFFCFVAFSGVSKRWELKNTTKTFYKNKSCRKVFTKNKSAKSPKPIFSRFFCYHVFGRFSVRGVQKHHKIISKKNLTLVIFWPLTHPRVINCRLVLWLG